MTSTTASNSNRCIRGVAVMALEMLGVINKICLKQSINALHEQMNEQHVQRLFKHQHHVQYNLANEFDL